MRPRGGSGSKIKHSSRPGRIVASRMPGWLNVNVSGYILSVAAGSRSSVPLCKGS